MARFSVALISSDIDATQRLSAFYAQREIDLENLEPGADLESAIEGNGYDLLLLDMASSETAQKVFESCSSLVGGIVALADKDDTDASVRR